MPTNNPEQQEIHSPLLQALCQSTQEKAKLFQLVDSLVQKDPLLLEPYLQVAFSLLGVIDKSFIQDRDRPFFSWLINHLKEIEKDGQSKVHTCTHTVSYPFQDKEVVGLLLHFREISFKSLPDLQQIQHRLMQEFPAIQCIDGSCFSLVQGKKPNLTLYFEVQKTGALLTDQEIVLIKEFLVQMVQKDFQLAPLSVIVPSNRELLFKSLRGTLDSMKKGDRPQVLIDFSRQVDNTLHFSALICPSK